MVRFECTRCGKCCISLGSCISIERRLSDRDFYCRNAITREIFPVHIQADAAGLPEDEPDLPDNPSRKRCVFMREDRTGQTFSCAIYQNRPSVCRQFRCYRMLIFDPAGGLCGKVVGKNTLSCADPALEKLWRERIAGVPHAHPADGNDPAWVKTVTSLLAEFGYRGEPAE